MSIRVAFMTTLGVNIGDEFIREGIRSFLDEVLPPYEALYVNKHDLATLSTRCLDETSNVGDKFRDAQVIVQAGAPVYWNHGPGRSACWNVEWAQSLWFERIFRLGPAKPILNIGAGSAQPYHSRPEEVSEDPRSADFARRVAAACRWTSVRDPLAGEILASLQLPHEALPCPALHAARRHPLRRARPDGLIGVNLMPLGGHYRLAADFDPRRWSDVITALLPRLRRMGRLLFIAHDPVERDFMERWREGEERVFHAPTWHEYLPVYGGCRVVLANRVHGAVAAAGFGVPAIIVGNDSRLRIGEYIGLPSHYVADVTASDLAEGLRRLWEDAAAEGHRLITLRESSAARYREALRPHLADLGEADAPGGGASRGAAIAAPTAGTPPPPAYGASPAGAGPDSPDGVDVPSRSASIMARVHPQRVLVPRFDTLSNLILLEGLLDRLLAEHPDCSVTLLVRRGLEQLAPLFPAALRWHAVSVDPAAEAGNGFDELRSYCKTHPYDLVVGTSVTRSWADEATALLVAGEPYRVTLAGPAGPSPVLEPVSERLRSIRREAAERPAWDDVVSVDDRGPAATTYQLLWQALSGSETRLPDPRLVLPESMSRESETVLERLALERGRYVVCAPTGTVNVSIKAWPIERFAQIISWLEQTHGLPVLLMGHRSELDRLETVRHLSEARPSVWTGEDGQIPLAAALVAHARLYVGNETSLMHLAAALGVPAVAVFGGGRWGRFLPPANTTALVHELPCFSCDWHCVFAHPLCLELISTAAVRDAITTLLTAERSPIGPSRVVSLTTTMDQRGTVAWIAKAWARWHQSEAAGASLTAQLGASREHTDRQAAEIGDLSGQLQALREYANKIQAQLAALNGWWPVRVRRRLQAMARAGSRLFGSDSPDRGDGARGG